MVELYFNTIPLFIKKGKFFKPLNEDFKLNKESITIPFDKFKEDDKINSLEDLLLYFASIDYFMVSARYISFHIYEYIYTHRKKIIENYELITHIKKFSEMHFLVNVVFDSNSISLSSIRELLDNNYLNVLKIINSIYLWKSRLEYEYVCEFAAQGGNYHCLKYLYESDNLIGSFYWNRILKIAAEYGHLQIIIYSHQHGCKLNKRAYIAAALNGNLDCLKYLIEYGDYWQYGTIENALLFGNYDLSVELSSGGSNFIAEEEFCKNNYIAIILRLAVLGGNLDCLKLIYNYINHQNNYIYFNYGTMYSFAIAAKFGRLDCMKYMYENGCSIDSRAIKYAKKYGHLDCVEYLSLLKKDKFSKLNFSGFT
jgi:ankyrin repeat protein